MNKIKDGARVWTKHGSGVVVGSEFYSRNAGGTYRYGVELKDNPFPYPVAYYWDYEIREILKP